MLDVLNKCFETCTIHTKGIQSCIALSRRHIFSQCMCCNYDDGTADVFIISFIRFVLLKPINLHAPFFRSLGPLFLRAKGFGLPALDSVYVGNNNSFFFRVISVAICRYREGSIHIPLQRNVG